MEERTVHDADGSAIPAAGAPARSQLGQLHVADQESQSILGVETSQPAVQKMVGADEDDDTTVESMSPAASVSTESKDEPTPSPSQVSATLVPSSTSSLNYEYSSVRVITANCQLYEPY